VGALPTRARTPLGYDARVKLRVLVGGACWLAAACAGPPDVGGVRAASTVAEYEQSTCATAVVLELSRQIAGEVGCSAPGRLVPFAEGGGIVFTGGAVLPYVAAAARDDLLAAVQATGGDRLELTSGYRTLPQQYLLYRWWQLGRCGITAAATPGNSNHESGRAIDVGNYDAWTAVLPAFGWEQTVAGDPVHFDHLASPDLRGTDVLAFQRLWNRNHPGDRIDEDGLYGPMTEARVKQAPAEGFALGPSCGPGGLMMAVDRIEAPMTLAPGEHATAVLTLRNTGSAPWPAGSALVTSEPAGRGSALADASWPAPDRAAVIAGEVAGGAVTTLEVAIVAPDGAPLELSETFALAAGDVRFGALTLVLTVEEPPATTGGCAAGGGARAPLALFVLAPVLVLARRRRRVRR
jgi:hypothetical protein